MGILQKRILLIKLTYKQKLHTLKYAYDKDRFFPVIYEGELLNTDEFILYKLRCLLFHRTLV